jgi:hypothetical protein
VTAKKSERWATISYTYVILILIIAASFVFVRGNLYVAITFAIGCVGVALRNKWAIMVARAFFGLIAALGVMLFFNPFLLRDFSGGRDLVSVIPFAALVFIGYELVFLLAFYHCSKIRTQQKTQ